MNADDLNNAMTEWGLSSAQLAKVLCLHSNKLSEYLAGVQRIPCAFAYSIGALQLLTAQQRSTLFDQRLLREPHQHSSA